MVALHEHDLLIPHCSHPVHVLTEGMLLHNADGCLHPDKSSSLVAQVCDSCLLALQKQKVPLLSLANRMWIGETPLELKVLTLPERVLVARHFPAAYIVKLFPKKKGARHWDNSGFHSGLQGNVSTYRLNTEGIAKLIGDLIMPPPSTILAATVGVTFVGPKNVP
jgi:hypothetical protein